MKFWNSVKEDWNNPYPDDKYETWKGVKKYERVMEKLKDRYESDTPRRIA